MSEQERIEQQIREILSSEKRAVHLSDKLFGPRGLFSQLGATEEERRRIAQTSLFREAQRCLSKLQRREAEEFARAVEQVRTPGSEGDFLLKLEPARTP